MDLVEISPEMVEISSDLKNFSGKCSLFRFSRVSSGLGEKTCQPTRYLQVLEAETRRRLSLVSGQLVLGLDWTVFAGGSGTSFLWTALRIIK